MTFRIAVKLSLAVALVASVLAWSSESKSTTVRGYVLDSACAFTKDLKKPISDFATLKWPHFDRYIWPHP